MKLITQLSGYEKLKAHLNKENADCNLIVRCNVGEGRTTILRYCFERLSQKYPLKFSENDPILEYKTFDGTQGDAERIIANIYDKTERKNSFDGIISLPGNDLARHINSTSVQFLFDHLCGELGEDAIIVFFLSDDNNQAALVSKLKEYFVCEIFEDEQKIEVK